MPDRRLAMIFSNERTTCPHGCVLEDDASGCDDCDIAEFAARIVEMSETELEEERWRILRLVPHEFFRASVRDACLTAIEFEKERRSR